MSTVTFPATNGPNWFEITVKSDFLKECPKPDNMTIHDLMVQHKMVLFLHNDKGPAILKYKTKEAFEKKELFRKEYWTDGDKCTEEQQKAIEHKEVFGQVVKEVLFNEDV